jgi:AraC family ethanolamine operon transcriptional activator
MWRSLSEIVSTVTAPHTQRLDPEHVRRAAAEAFGLAFLHAGAEDDREPILAATKVIRQVDDFLDRIGPRAVHISELCFALKVSHRSLHRAFSEVLGIGPIAYLRQRGLSSAYSSLRRADQNNTTVMDVAAEHGFLEFGRFSAYYRQLFDEYPAQTLRRTP